MAELVKRVWGKIERHRSSDLTEMSGGGRVSGCRVWVSVHFLDCVKQVSSSENRVLSCF